MAGCPEILEAFSRRGGSTFDAFHLPFLGKGYNIGGVFGAEGFTISGDFPCNIFYHGTIIGSDFAYTIQWECAPTQDLVPPEEM